MIVQPFGFLQGAAGGGGFDPTLGGAITPYFWYDFTDSSTMTFSSGNNITAIASKGSNTGDIAKGSTINKYTSYWIAPTWEGDYTQFYGNSGGTNYNSTLSRLYSSDGTGGNNDTPFYHANAMSIVSVYQVDFTAVTDINAHYVMSIKANNNLSQLGFDEFTPLVVNTWSSYNATIQYISTTTVKAPAAGLHALRNSNQAGLYSYNGVSPSNTGWVMQGYSHDASGGTTNGDFYREVSEVANFANRIRSSAGVSTWENFSIGSRSRNDVLGSAPFKLKHVVVYDFNIDTDNYQLLLDNYNAAFPGDDLNGVTN